MSGKSREEQQRLWGAQGGHQRSAKLTKAERSQIARKAAEARWAKEGKEVLTQATHIGTLVIGDIELECAVLEDGTRVLTQAGFLTALGRHPKANVKRREGEEPVPPIMQGRALKPFISRDLLEKSRPIQFRTVNGGRASGYSASLLPEVCEIYLKAREAEALPKNQEHVAARAEILVRGLAHVGIVALVDEATGYQDYRDRNALEKILERFLQEEFAKWAKRFPDEFYRQIFRLHGWKYNPSRRPGVVGKYTTDLVYERLAPGLRRELERLNPKDGRGRRRVRHHQWLTEDIGHPKLQEHLASIIVLMKAVDSWQDFKKLVNRALPKQPDMPLFDGPAPSPVLQGEE